MSGKAFTSIQQKQLRFLESVEGREELYRQPQLSCSCATCNDGKTFSSADGARSFIKNHIGHSTWVQHLGTVKHRGLGA